MVDHPLRAISIGVIHAFRAVCRDSDAGARQATANERCIGIGPDWPVEPGEAFPLFHQGVALSELGSTVVRGDRLVSDSEGRLVPVRVDTGRIQNVVGLATRSGVKGDIVPVQIEIWREPPTKTVEGTTERKSIEYSDEPIGKSERKDRPDRPSIFGHSARFIWWLITAAIGSGIVSGCLYYWDKIWTL